MNNRPFTGGMAFGAIVAVFLCAGMLLPGQPLSAAVQNNPPQITSVPAASITAGSTYSYEILTSDADGDTLAYRITAKPGGMGLAGSLLQWQPTAIGTFNVAIEADDGNGGFDSQSWQITVGPGPVYSVAVTPNDRPTIVVIGETKQFSAIATDAYGNEIADAAIAWSTDESVGSINENGTFTPSRGGIGFAAATAGGITASNGLVVKDNRIDQVDPLAVEPAPEGNDPAEPAEAAVAAENGDAAQQEEASEAEQDPEAVTLVTDNVSDVSGAEEDEVCENWPHWLILSLLALYAVILISYYWYEKKHPTGAWWIFPALLTAIGFVAYYKYVCEGTYLWWPWLFVVIGICATLFLKGKPKTGSGSAQGELPF
ncbi:MAG: putative Ig domain-containing protein [Patescibacteria group bacterium]